MKNTFGSSVAVTLFGESHGEQIGVVIDGMAPGIEVDEDFIRERLELRRPFGQISTSRREQDRFRIVSGVFEGKTTGTPICIIIPNEDTRSRDYSKIHFLARPGHADYTAYCKYHGFEDYRGGGHFSGRITAGLVAGGAIAMAALKKCGISLGTHICSLGGIPDRDFKNYAADIEELNKKRFAVLDENRSAEMIRLIEDAAAEGDSVGGVLETAVTGVPKGVGEPWFDSIESVLARALFGVPAVKGIEFGAGFGLVNARGSEYNDAFYVNNGEICTRTNNNGGINGGITNGMPIIFRTAIKPTPSIYKIQDTVDFYKNEDTKLQINGRHDPAIIHRARVVVDSVAALVLCDILAGRFGTDFLASGEK